MIRAHGDSPAAEAREPGLKKPDSQDNILYDSIDVTSWKRQSYGEGVLLGLKGTCLLHWGRTGDLWGVMEPFCTLTEVVILPCT